MHNRGIMEDCIAYYSSIAMPQVLYPASSTGTAKVRVIEADQLFSLEPLFLRKDLKIVLLLYHIEKSSLNI
jgi:hypothetical protein